MTSQHSSGSSSHGVANDISPSRPIVFDIPFLLSYLYYFSRLLTVHVSTLDRQVHALLPPHKLIIFGLIIRFSSEKITEQSKQITAEESVLQQFQIVLRGIKKALSRL